MRARGRLLIAASVVVLAVLLAAWLGWRRMQHDADVALAAAAPQAPASQALADAWLQPATQQGVGALVVSANDPKAICDALNQARQSGVKVVTFDSDTDASCRDLFVNQASADGIAKVQVDLIAKQIGDSGEIAVLSAAANATNQNAWIEKMKALLASDHPNIKLVDVVYGDDDGHLASMPTLAVRFGLHPAHTYSVVHHRDVAAAVRIALDGKLDVHIANVADDCPVTVFDMARAAGTPIEGSAAPLAHPWSGRMDSSFLRGLGFRPEVPTIWAAAAEGIL